MTAESDNVGSISVDVGLNITPFREGMKAVEDALTALATREATTAPLDIPKLDEGEVKRWERLAKATATIQQAPLSGGPSSAPASGGGGAAMSHMAFSDQDATEFGTKIAAAVENALRDLTINIQIGNLDDIKRELGSVQINELKVGQVVSQGGGAVHMAAAQAVPGTVADQSRALILNQMRTSIEKSGIGGDIHVAVEKLNTKLKAENQRLVDVFDDAADQLVAIYQRFGARTQDELGKAGPKGTGRPTIQTGALAQFASEDTQLSRVLLGMLNKTKTNGVPSQLAQLLAMGGTPGHVAQPVPVHVVQQSAPAPAAAVPTAEVQKAAIVQRQEQQQPPREPGNNAVSLAARPPKSLDDLIGRAQRLNTTIDRATQQKAPFWYDELGNKHYEAQGAAPPRGPRTSRPAELGNSAGNAGETGPFPAGTGEVRRVEQYRDSSGQLQQRYKDRRGRPTSDPLLAKANISLGGRSPFLYGEINERGIPLTDLARSVLRGAFANQAVDENGNYVDRPIDDEGKPLRLPNSGGSISGRQGVFKPVTESQLVRKALRRLGVDDNRADVALGKEGIFTEIMRARNSGALRSPISSGAAGDPDSVARAARDLVHGQSIIKRLEYNLAEAEGRIAQISESRISGELDKRGRRIPTRPGTLYFTDDSLRQEALDQAKHQRQMALERLQQGQSKFSRGQLRYVAETVGGAESRARIEEQLGMLADRTQGPTGTGAPLDQTLGPKDREKIALSRDAAQKYPAIANTEEWLKKVYDDILGVITDPQTGKVTRNPKGGLPIESASDEAVRRGTERNLEEARRTGIENKYPVPIIAAMPDENGKMVQRQLSVEEWEAQKKKNPQFTARAALRERLYGTIESLYDAAGLTGHDRSLRKLDDLGFTEVTPAVQALFGHQKNYMEFSEAARQRLRAGDTRASMSTTRAAGTRANPRNRELTRTDFRTEIPGELLTERDRLMRERDAIEKKYGIHRLQAGINVSKGSIAGTQEMLDQPGYARRSQEDIERRVRDGLMPAIAGAGARSSTKSLEGIVGPEGGEPLVTADGRLLPQRRKASRGQRTEADVERERAAAAAGIERLIAQAGRRDGLYEKLSPTGEGTGKYITGRTYQKHLREATDAQAAVDAIEEKIKENTRTYSTSTGLTPAQVRMADGTMVTDPQGRMMDAGAGNLSTGDQEQAAGMIPPPGGFPPLTPAEMLGSRSAQTSANEAMRGAALASLGVTSKNLTPDNLPAGVSEGVAGQGPVHVIVDGQPVDVRVTNGGGGGNDVPFGLRKKDESLDRAAKANIDMARGATFKTPEGRGLAVARYAMDQGWNDEEVGDLVKQYYPASAKRIMRGVKQIRLRKAIDTAMKEGRTGESESLQREYEKLAGGWDGMSGGGSGSGGGGGRRRRGLPEDEEDPLYDRPGSNEGRPGIPRKRIRSDFGPYPDEGRPGRRPRKPFRDEYGPFPDEGRPLAPRSPLGPYPEEGRPGLGAAYAKMQARMNRITPAVPPRNMTFGAQQMITALQRRFGFDWEGGLDMFGTPPGTPVSNFRTPASRSQSMSARANAAVRQANVGNAEDRQAADLSARLRRMQGQLGQRAFGPTIVSTFENFLAGTPLLNREKTVNVPDGAVGPGMRSLPQILGADINNQIKLPGDPFSRINLVRREESETNLLANRVAATRRTLQGQVMARADQQTRRDTMATQGASPKQLANADEGLKKFDTQITATRSKLKEEEKAAGEAAAGTEFLAKNAAGASDILGNLAAGFVGGSIAAVITPLAAGMGPALIGLLKPVLEPMYESAIGYQNVTNKVIDSLSDQIKSTHEAARQTVGLTAAQAGLAAATYARVGPSLEQAATIEAGNKAFGGWMDLIRAGQSLNGEKGAPPGLFQNTGGLNILGMQTPIGGTPSTIENILGGFNGVNRWQGLVPYRHNDIPSQFLDVGGDLLRDLRAPQDSTGSVPIGIGTGLSFGPKGVHSTAVPPWMNPQAIAQINNMNDQMARMPGGFSFALSQDRKKDADGLVAITKAMMAAKVDPRVIADWNAMGLVIHNANGSLTTDLPSITEAIQEFADAPTVMDWKQQLNTMTGPRGSLTLQLDELRRTTDLARGQQASSFYVQQLANPALPFIGGPSSPLAGQAAYAQGITSQFSGLGAGATQQFLTSGGLSAAQQQQGQSDLAMLTTLGQSTAAAQAQARAIQMTQTARDAAHQIELQTRQVGDLAAMTGQSSVNVPGAGTVQATQYGQLGYANFQLSHQLQQQQFQHAELGLNYQTALAGFMGEGATGEERAARQEIALREAAYQKTQLKGQETLAGNSYQMAQIENQRNLNEGMYALSTTVSNFNDSKRLQELQDLLQKNATATSAVTADLEQLTGEGAAYGQIVIGLGEQFKGLGAKTDDLGQNFDNLNTMIQKMTGITPTTAIDPTKAIDQFFGKHAADNTTSAQSPFVKNALDLLGGAPDMKNSAFQALGSGGHHHVTIVNPSAGVDTQALVRVVMGELNRQAGLRGLTTVGGR